MLIVVQRTWLIAEDPELLSGIDAHKLKAYQTVYSKGFKPYMEASQKPVSMGSGCFSYARLGTSCLS